MIHLGWSGKNSNQLIITKFFVLKNRFNHTVKELPLKRWRFDGVSFFDLSSCLLRYFSLAFILQLKDEPNSLILYTDSFLLLFIIFVWEEMNRLIVESMAVTRRAYSRSPSSFSLLRFASIRPGSTQKGNKSSKALKIFLLTVTGTSAGLVMYFSSTNHYQLFSYARNHWSNNRSNVTWRDCLAFSLVDLYRQHSGASVINRLHSGYRLGKWIINDKLFLFLYCTYL